MSRYEQDDDNDFFQVKMSRLAEQGKSYCAETSLHGLKYITEDGRHIVERVIWIILFTSAMCLMISFMIPGRAGRSEQAQLFTVCHDIGPTWAINNSSFINNAEGVHFISYIEYIAQHGPSFVAINHLLPAA